MKPRIEIIHRAVCRTSEAPDPTKCAVITINDVEFTSERPTSTALQIEINEAIDRLIESTHE